VCSQLATSSGLAKSEEDLGDRVWLAYRALPLDEFGQPPPLTKLEEEHGISRGTLGKLIDGSRPSVRTPTLALLAAALETSVQFLATGEGRPPTPKFLPPRPRKYDADGNPPPPPAIAATPTACRSTWPHGSRVGRATARGTRNGRIAGGGEASLVRHCLS
jgi:hypothetical protein